MEIYNGLVPPSNEVINFEASRSTDRDHAIALCVSSALDTLYTWLDMDNGSEMGFEPITSGLMAFLGIDAANFIVYRDHEFMVNVDIDREGLQDIFTSGSRMIDIPGIIDFVLRNSITHAITVIDYSGIKYDGEGNREYDFEGSRAVSRIEDAIKKELAKPIIETNSIAGLLSEYVPLAVNDSTNTEALTFQLATFYTAGVAYAGLLSEGRE